jgi:hypothetical protein
MKRTLAATMCSIAAAAAYGSPAATECNALDAADKVVALNQIQNLMGRYSHLGTLRGESTLAELFAMKTEGVSWKTPYGPTSIAGMKQRFERPVEADPGKTAGQLHMHAMLSPVIEIAGDGKTAKGVWDSFGPNIINGQAIGNWLWVKYGVDFIREDGQWKIWHLQVYPIFNTPYDKSVTQTARERAAKGAPVGPPRVPGWTGPNDLWMYDGKTPPRGPKIPEPYCVFDPANAY